MTDRVDSAERLLATIEAGRAHVRALAMQYLPPGRAFALDLQALSPNVRPALAPPAPRPPVLEAAPVAPARSRAPAPEPAAAIAPSSLEADVGEENAPRESVGEEPPDPVIASAPAEAPSVPTQYPDPAAADGPSLSTDTLAAHTSALDGPADHAVEAPSDTAETDEAQAAAPETAAGEDIDESTQIISVDDELRAAIASARTAASVHTAGGPDDPAPSLQSFGQDEDTSDDDNDPGSLLGADDVSEDDSGGDLLAAPSGGGLSDEDDNTLAAGVLDDMDWGDGSVAPPPTEDSALGLDTRAEPGEGVLASGGLGWPSSTNEPSDEPDVLEEESGSLEQTLLHQGSEIFGDQLDPLAGWSFDDDSLSKDVVVGGMDWGDSPSEDAEPDQDATRIEQANPALLAALRDADSAESDDEFELSADQLQWGDAHGDTMQESVQESVSVPADAMSDGADILEGSLRWDSNEDDTPWSRSDDLAPDVMELEDNFSDGPPALDAFADDPSDDDDGERPRVSSFGDEHLDAEPTEAHVAPESEDDSEPVHQRIHAPDVLEDDPLDSTLFHRPIVEFESAAPAPALAVPRVVEPRATDSLEEHTGAAAIQILGVGMAQTLTPTLELGAAPDESDTSSITPVVESRGGDDDGFSLDFEEPEEANTGPHIPVLTEDVEVTHNPAVLTPDGVLVTATTRSDDPGLEASEAKEFLEQAHAAEKRGNLRDAVVHYDDLLSHDPHNLAGHLGRGRCLVDLGDYGSAMSDFTRAEDIAPDSPEPLVEMGNLFFARKEYKRAITYYNHAIDLDQQHAMAFSRRGISHYHRRMYAEAHNDLTEAEKRDPSIPGLQRYIQMTSRKLKKRR
jgi:hypothetical protein